MMDDVKTCRLAIENNGEYSWWNDLDSDGLVTDDIEGFGLFDPAHMPRDVWLSVPANYMYALCRATGAPGARDWDTKKLDHKRLGIEFERHICKALGMWHWWCLADDQGDRHHRLCHLTTRTSLGIRSLDGRRHS